MITSLIACLIFSLFDYIGFNIGKANPKSLRIYRVVQVIFQLSLAYFFWSVFSWKVAIAFLLMWWTWLCDFMYYGWAYIINPKPNPGGNSWEGRADLAGTLNVVSWAWWTPYGLFINGIKNKTKIIPKSILIAQAGVGIWLALLITLWL